MIEHRRPGEKSSMPSPKIEFWYEFASTYSYLSAMRIEALAEAAGVTVEWRPFLLGPIFRAQGWTTSPFNLYPAKGRNMVRDIERIAAARGLAFALPASFPQNSLQAARLALVGVEEGWVAPFSRAVYLAQFAEGVDIADRAVLAGILRSLQLDSERILSRIEQPDLKQQLKQQTSEAQARGLFGAPSFTVGEELFWGDDRLEQALAWAKPK
jgi:2-hydroxychromene-2-carboxylate isomerase